MDGELHPFRGDVGADSPTEAASPAGCDMLRNVYLPRFGSIRDQHKYLTAQKGSALFCALTHVHSDNFGVFMCDLFMSLSLVD